MSILDRTTIGTRIKQLPGKSLVNLDLMPVRTMASRPSRAFMSDLHEFLEEELMPVEEIILEAINDHQLPPSIKDWYVLNPKNPYAREDLREHRIRVIPPGNLLNRNPDVARVVHYAPYQHSSMTGDCLLLQPKP